MKSLALLFACSLLCIAATNMSRQAQRLNTAVKVGDTDLFNIVRDGSAAKLIAALLGGGDVNATDGAGMSLLHHAAQLGRDDMVAVLRRRGANEALLNNAKRTALQLAQEGKHTKVVELLHDDVKETEAIAKVDGCDNSLHVASLAGDMAEIERLLAGGADVNAIDSLGRTALHYAALKGNAELVNLLLANHAELGIEDNFGNTPATAAQFAQQPHIVSVLEEQQASVTELAEQVEEKQEEQTDKKALRRAALAVREQNKTCTRSPVFSG